MTHWRFRVRAFLPPNQGGGIAIETVHSSEASKFVEVLAIRERIRRGELSHALVVDKERPFIIERIDGASEEPR